MGEIRDLNEILSGVDALDRRLRAIEEYRKNALSDEALREMREELDLIRAALGAPETDRRHYGAAARQENARETGWYHRTGPAVYQGGAPQDKPAPPRIAGSGKFVPKGHSNVWIDPPAPKTRRTNWSERNLGKYLLGVLAAVLVLLAAGVLIAAVWPVIPDILKFLALLAFGVGMQLIGMRFVLQSENRRNGFWLSVTGLGAGVSLMAAAAGCISWGLYPLTVAGLLAAIWFGCNLLCARNLDSPVFYVIAYIGAALAVTLSVNLTTAGSRPDLAPLRLADQIPVAVMPILILMLGSFAAFRHPRRCLRVLNYLASLFFICMLGEFASDLASHVSETRWGVSALFYGFAPGVVIAPAILVILVHLLYISPDALAGAWKKPELDWLRVLSVVIAGFAGIFAIYAGISSVALYVARLFAGNDLTAVVTGVVVSLAAVAVIVTRKDQADYLLLGLTVPMTLLLASVSDDLFDSPCLFPALLCVLLLTLHKLREGFSSKLSLWLAMGLTGIMIVSQSERYHGADGGTIRYVLPFIAACTAYLAVLCLTTYAGELKRAERSEWYPITSLGCAVLIGLTAAKGAYTAMVYFRPDAGSETVYSVLVTSALLFHRWYVQAKTRNESGTAGQARLLWSVCAGIYTIYLHMCVVFTSGLERGVCIMVLTAMAGSTVAWASTSGSKVYAVLSVLFANETLAFAGGVNDVYGLFLSVLGVCLCAGFIWLGFFKELRTMRRLGLAGMILYVVKIALLDVQSARGSVVSTALGLLFAGLVCFGVSFVYNRLDKKYGGDDS